MDSLLLEVTGRSDKPWGPDAGCLPPVASCCVCGADSLLACAQGTAPDVLLPEVAGLCADVLGSCLQRDHASCCA